MEVHAVATIILKDKKLLVVKEKDEDEYHTPGGTIKEFETLEEALKRELMEEIGVKLKTMKTFGKINDDNLLLEVFSTEVSGTPKPSSEIEDLQWVGKNYQDGGIRLTIPSQKQILKLIESNLIE